MTNNVPSGLKTEDTKLCFFFSIFFKDAQTTAIAQEIAYELHLMTASNLFYLNRDQTAVPCTFPEFSFL